MALSSEPATWRSSDRYWDRAVERGCLRPVILRRDHLRRLCKLSRYGSGPCTRIVRCPSHRPGCRLRDIPTRGPLTLAGYRPPCAFQGRCAPRSCPVVDRSTLATSSDSCAVRGVPQRRRRLQMPTTRPERSPRGISPRPSFPCAVTKHLGPCDHLRVTGVPVLGSKLEGGRRAVLRLVRAGGGRPRALGGGPWVWGGAYIGDPGPGCPLGRSGGMVRHTGRRATG